MRTLLGACRGREGKMRCTVPSIRNHACSLFHPQPLVTAGSGEPDAEKTGAAAHDFGTVGLAACAQLEADR